MIYYKHVFLIRNHTALIRKICNNVLGVFILELVSLGPHYILAITSYTDIFKKTLYPY